MERTEERLPRLVPPEPAERAVVDGMYPERRSLPILQNRCKRLRLGEPPITCVVDRSILKAHPRVPVYPL